MAPVNECALVKSGKTAQACTTCKLDNSSTVNCALKAMTKQEALDIRAEAQNLVIPPMGGPRFTEVRARLQQLGVPNVADRMATLFSLIK